MTESRKTLEPAEPSTPRADRESPVAPRSERVLADHGASRASARADDHTPTSVRSTRESVARESVTESAVAPEHSAPEASEAREVSEPGLPSAVIVSGVPVAPVTPGRVTSTKRYKFMRGKLRWLFLLVLCPAVFGLAYRAHEVGELPSPALTVDSKAGESAKASIAVVSSPPAEVVIDGKRYGVTPVQLELPGRDLLPGRELMFHFSREGYDDLVVRRMLTREPMRVEATLRARVPLESTRRTAEQSTRGASPAARKK